VLKVDHIQQEQEVEAVTASLDEATLEDRQVEIPVEIAPPGDAPMIEVPSDSSPSTDTETKPEPENPFPTPPNTPPLYEDPSNEDDGEGEWITPTNVALHKSKALQLIPAQGGANEKVVTGCMTTDFAMQNVLMHMGLSLVGVDGKKIDKVKTWVLRCHACFK
jgi:RNA-binding protein NOB1